MSDLITYDWEAELVSVTDGDTVRMHLMRGPVGIDNDFEVVVQTRRDGKGIPIRLVTLQTPERGHPDWSQARRDLTGWIIGRIAHLRVQTYESAKWDRLLGDVYDERDRGETASQFMLKLGWPPFSND